LGGRRDVQARQLVRQVKFSLGSSSQREFSSANFYMFGKSFCEVGLNQLLCDWLLEWNIVSSEARLSSVHPGGPSVLYLKQSLAGSLPGAPQITWFTVMGCSPLLMSDKISTS